MMSEMLTMLKRLGNEESGQDLIEYALLAALIALAAIAAMTQLGFGINAKFDEVKNKLAGG
jgi:pilus assembly protein Flp/PilA